MTFLAAVSIACNRSMAIATARHSPDTVCFSGCERLFSLQCADAGCRKPLGIVFGALVRPATDAETPVVSLGRVSSAGGRDRFLYEPPGAQAQALNGHSELIYEVDKNLGLALQRARPDLLFLHAAVVELDGRAIVLCGHSGTGKSTTTFALLHHGFGYLSDELAPVDVASGIVHPFAHALCLKQVPPAPYRLPSRTLDAGETLHVPVAALPGAAVLESRPLAALVFLQREAEPRSRGLQPLTSAAACAHVLSSALNALAHPDQGADAALEIVRRVPAFRLDIGELSAAVAALRSLPATSDVGR